MQTANYQLIASSSRAITLIVQLKDVPAIIKPISKDKKKKKKSRQVKRLNFQPDTKFSYLYSQLKCSNIFYIRGGLLVDVDILINSGDSPCSLYFQNDFKPVREVKHFKDDGFFQLSFHEEECAEQIQDFRFIINMLNSMGSFQLHQTAILFENYLNAFNLLDEQKSKETPTSNESDDILIESFTINETWTYEQSLKQANIILRDKLKAKSVIMYGILQGQQDSREITVMGLKEALIKLVLGNVEQQEIVKILLKQGSVFLSPALQSVTQKKLDEMLFYANNDSTKEPEFNSKSSRESFFTVNNLVVLNTTISFEYYKLSSYANKFNDYLLIAKLDPDEEENFMGQLFVQKLLCEQSPLDLKILLSDLTYAAQSEHFIERFYSGSDKTQESLSLKSGDHLNERKEDFLSNNV